MKREWYLIDDEGIHPLNIHDESEHFWDHLGDGGDDEAPWPEFNQLIVDTSPAAVAEALRETAPELNIDLREVTDDPEQWDEGIVVARAGDLVAVGEPGVDLDECVVARPWSEQLVDRLACSGVFFGYDGAADTLHLIEFEAGEVDFAWSDSLSPGPSYAMVFDEEGAVREEDPRRFALTMLDLPETSPFLDRYQFVVSRLEQLGLETVSPRLDEFPVAAVFAATKRSDVAHG